MSSKENQTKALGELTTFYEMLASHDRKKRFDEIVIPKIQRDYAQGRSGRSLMRSRFLKRLFSAIDRDGAKEIKLDFVYGQANDNAYRYTQRRIRRYKGLCGEPVVVHQPMEHRPHYLVNDGDAG